MRTRINDMLLGIILSKYVESSLPDALNVFKIPTEIGVYLIFLLVCFAGTLLTKGYRKVVKKIAKDVKKVIDDNDEDLSA